MNYCNTIVGLDVHKQTIVAAVLPQGADHPTETVSIENHPKAIEKLVNRAAAAVDGAAEFVYEAGPCGYEVQRQIAAMGYRCSIIAPSLTPVRPGDRVKTDRRDAKKLAKLQRAGELTEIRIPTRMEEAARDLVRVREDALGDRQRARHRTMKFLLRQGRIYYGKTWGKSHQLWLSSQRFEWPSLQQSFEAYTRAAVEIDARMAVLDQQLQDLAQQPQYLVPVKFLRCFKGIDTLSALTLIVEAQQFSRFGKARAFMSYTGVVASEFSSGRKICRGSITKAGNAHIRRILVESAWSYSRRSVLSRTLAERRKGCPPEVVQLAQKAQDRLQRKFARMVSRGKPHQVAVVAVARELAGFIWAMAQFFPAVA